MTLANTLKPSKFDRYTALDQLCWAMLQIIATPIGNWGDISHRAHVALRDCDILIGEEFRVASTLLKKLGLPQKEIYELNEHSQKKDLAELVELCAEKNVALISDCGTPVFSDPGAELIAACRRKNIAVTTLPGASSLMALISLSSKPVKQFLFYGFLPAEKAARAKALENLKRENHAWILMDTPYRLKSTLEELAKILPQDQALLGINLTQPEEQILEGSFSELHKKCQIEKGEFMILRYAK